MTINPNNSKLKNKKGSENMPSKYDLIQMIIRDNHYASDTIQDVNEIIADIDNNPKKFTYELSKEIEEFAEKLQLCPLCGEPIVQIGVDYEPSEYFGQPVQEKSIRYGCDSASCGYIKD